MQRSSYGELLLALKQREVSDTLIPIYNKANHECFLIAPGSPTVVLDKSCDKPTPLITAPFAAGVTISLKKINKNINTIKIKALYFGWKDRYYDEIYKFDVDLSFRPLNPDYICPNISFKPNTKTIDGAAYNALQPNRIIKRNTSIKLLAQINILSTNDGLLSVTGDISDVTLVNFPGIEFLGYDLEIHSLSKKPLTKRQLLKYIFLKIPSSTENNYFYPTEDKFPINSKLMESEYD